MAILSTTALAQNRLKPWKLRENFQWKSPHGDLYFFTDNGEWRVVYGDGVPAIDYVGFEITLADGTLLTQDSLEAPVVDRDKFDDLLVFGPGNHYESRFPAKDGIAVTFRATGMNQYPFFFFQLLIANQREEPITLTQIKPFVVGPGGIPQRDALATLTTRHFNARAGRPVFDRNAPPLFAQLRYSDSPIFITFGVFPRGDAQHALHMDHHDGAWHGRIESSYMPGLRIAPGEVHESAPLFITSHVAAEANIDLYYAWALSTLQPTDLISKPPNAWVSVEAGEGLAQLVAAADAGKAAGITHALVPAGWEKIPGSHSGSGSDYPGNAAEIASRLRGAGATPGITIDPLAVQGLEDDQFIRSVDGQPWVDLRSEAARQAAVTHLRALLGKGFKFVAVPPSSITDAVLEQMGMSRAGADRLAFEIATQAAAGMPVYPTAGETLGSDAAAWAEAKSASNYLADYNVLCAPIRIQASNTDALPPEVAEAMLGWQGPIEVIGAPKAELAKALAPVLKADRRTLAANTGQ
jgi:hypothetical protein